MKTYTLTEVQELLRQQRELCMKSAVAIEDYYRGRFHGCIINRDSILNAPSPLLPTEEVGIKEVELHCRLDEQQCQQECEHKDNRRKCQYVTVVTKEDDYVPSDNNNEGASLASHSCTIKPYLQGTIDWEGMQNALIDDESINLSRSWTPHDDVIKWLKINLPKYYK